ncbi:MAG: ATP synthase subunit b [Candidatus Wolfebacteria bacterium GW2011_GWE1_48_7]|uniref:ATP synthase subunit b n=2 Tax=Candidatus Wolfeibacteriota TaxID=1752735 RepID=A0A0G1WIW2_9BACT|nr:MAG: F0F1-type ATP synthase subunit b, F-type H+-transporting ATPase subunit b [Candidatus Wolfebacteria bacterium GW2011_GWB1_47_1]KKU37216.1 MAG: ATP synthase subunit b [Candidatus Wolfebacteria bacterium GW2011_GWC2_46_275]KKU42624.1 MAG: ATP synthase subunit b [Candidatus Wolfebacteria bacterium GW2011_GWB2_46_69]KKU54641.1 MAG: ATP synthase subunit b [Candidatus Wolfebacteria bacterium GW2011_GWC1_47_103]KKU59188.1 MAG: ATP synthase subunit b [Candidatus Wolfebacteria bacterium GW2011_G
MEELIKTFHIDWKLIIAQLVNFAIVLFVLKRYAYGPVLKMMTERSDKIEKGIKDAEHAHKKLAEIADKEKEVLVEARKQASEIIIAAEAIALKNKEVIIAESKQQAEKMLSDAARKMEAEKNQMMQEIRTQIADLIVIATEKIIDEKMTTDKDKVIINNAING